MRWLFALLILCTSANALDNPVLPNAKLQLTTPQMGEGGLVSFLGELGARNLRGAITYANQWASCHRFKASGEYLAQDLRYATGPRRWTSQYSIGAEYQCFFSKTVFRDLFVAGTYVHSYHKGSVANRLAGADGGQARVGTTLSPWKCAYLSAEVDYDYVRYHKIYTHRKIVSGLGGSASLVQYLGREFSVRADAEFHQPYYFYEGAFQWNRTYSNFRVYSGVYMNYTQGREGLPNVLGGGLEIALSFGARAERCCRASSSGQGKCDSKWGCDLEAWSLQSAARIPVVLNIQDPTVASAAATACSPPTSSSIPTQQVLGGPTYTLDVSSYFSSATPLTYSAIGLPSGSTIDPNTGVISGNVQRLTFTPTVTATNSCGSTSQTFTLTFI